MPGGKRRRFSVKQNIATNDPKNAYDSDTSIKTKTGSQCPKTSRTRNKFFATGSKQPPQLDVVVECESSVILESSERSTSDTGVLATPSNIDFYNILSLNDNHHKENNGTNQINEILNQMDMSLKRDSRARFDKHSSHQHRVKVRSPKRRQTIDVYRLEYDNKITEGLDAIDWNQVTEEALETVEMTDSTNVNMIAVVHDELQQSTNAINPISQPTNAINPISGNHPSNNSLDDMCRICHGGEALSLELGQMISACGCRGTVGRVHVKCLERWLTESGKSRCELCGTRYITRRVHKYGFPKALAIWILSQNAKQLMVDSLGIMLMSPLAVVAAWLSGRTLAGLMTPESQQTPWPLASTFVLACMTLVCYYCWIVSAVTRHALGWWIWYRSQYEVRLQLQGDEE